MTTTPPPEGAATATSVSTGPPAAKPARERTPLTAARVLILQGLGLLAVLIAGGLIFYIWHQGYYYYSTNDAVVSGTMAGAAPASTGTIVSVQRQVGDFVHVGDTIATLDTGGGTSAVRSPITGTILNEGATPGEVIGAGQQLAQVVDLRSLYITAYVDESKVRDVHIGQGVDVTVDNAGMHGTVQLIVPVTAGETSPLPSTDYASGNFTAVTQRVPVHIRLYGSNGHTIYPGESATVTIHLHD
jgi:multidrug resistance efflux pump